VVVSGIPALETILPIIWAEKQNNPHLKAKAVFIREGTLTGFGKTHPLLRLAEELMDEMLIPFGRGWVHWNGRSENYKLERLFRRSTRLTRGLNVWFSASAVEDLRALLGPTNRNHVTIFDYAYLESDARYQRYLKALCGQFALGVSHASTFSHIPKPSNFIEIRRDGSFFAECLGSFSAVNRIVIHFDSMETELNLNNLCIKLPTIDRFDSGWLTYVNGVFHEKLKGLQAAGPIGLLVSRPSAKNRSADWHTPDRDLRREALIDIRVTFDKLGLVPVILLHPSEVRSRRELRGWTVMTDIHYSAMFGLAEHIVTFGSQIAEDSWRMGKRMIEYGPVRRVAFESEFQKNGKTVAAHSLSGLTKLLVTKSNT